MIIYEVIYTEENEDISSNNNIVAAYFPNNVVAKSFASKKKKQCINNGCGFVSKNRYVIGNSKKDVIMFLNKEINNENSKNE